MRVINTSRQALLAEDCGLADTFLSRMKGLLGRPVLRPGEGLIITRCQSIHMVFMRFSIDAVFVSKDHEVVGLVENIRPYAFSRIYWKAAYVIELPAGAIARTRTELRDRVCWKKAE